MTETEKTDDLPIDVQCRLALERALEPYPEIAQEVLARVSYRGDLPRYVQEITDAITAAIDGWHAAMRAEIAALSRETADKYLRSLAQMEFENLSEKSKKH